MVPQSASGAPEKNNGGSGLAVANGQAASAQMAEIRCAVGSPLVKPSADLCPGGLFGGPL